MSGRSPDISCSIKFCLKIPQILKFPFTFPELITPKTVCEKSHKSSGLPCKEADVPLAVLESLCAFLMSAFHPEEPLVIWEGDLSPLSLLSPVIPQQHLPLPTPGHNIPTALICCFISHCQQGSTLGRLPHLSLQLDVSSIFFNPDPGLEPEHWGLGAGPCPHTTVCAEMTFGLTVRCTFSLLKNYGKRSKEPFCMDGCKCSVARAMVPSLACTDNDSILVLLWNRMGWGTTLPLPPQAVLVTSISTTVQQGQRFSMPT